MSAITIAVLTIIGLFVLVLLGVHIGFSLALMSVVGITLITGSIEKGTYILATTTFESLRAYTFAVIPLFMLMGAFMSNSTIAYNMFNFGRYLLRRVPGGLGVTTVVCNAVFAAVTGVAVASAAIFSRVAVPEMVRHNYTPAFAAGTVAGSSTLGMLIPPSLNFILFGMLAEVSIGRLFVAGVVPGILLAIMFSISIMLLAKFKPQSVYIEGHDHKVDLQLSRENKDENLLKMTISVIPLFLLITVVLGGIWGGFFTPTEASAFGALGALIIGLGTGMGFQGVKKSFLDVAASTSAILFLLIAASMYSRMLTISGILNSLSNTVLALDVSPYAILALFMGIIILMGCVLDSSSIILVMVPIVAPIMATMGFDPIWFGVIFVLFVHLGLLTPPFGMCVFTVQSAVEEPIAVETIFKSSTMFLLVMFIHALICIAFPILSTWLPGMM